MGIAPSLFFCPLLVSNNSNKAAAVNNTKPATLFILTFQLLALLKLSTTDKICLYSYFEYRMVLELSEHGNRYYL